MPPTIDGPAHFRLSQPGNIRTFTLWLCGFLTLILIWIGFRLRGFGSAARSLWLRRNGCRRLTFVNLIFALPALLLPGFNRLIGVAFTLAVLGLVCYAYEPILRPTAFLGN